MANLFAQAEGLAFGKTADELAGGACTFQMPFRVMEGNRPTNINLADALTPASAASWLFMSTAYLPKARCRPSTVLTSGAWNSARYWATRIIPELQSGGEPSPTHDNSTNALIRRYRTGAANARYNRKALFSRRSLEWHR
jgi:glucose-6-phosphate isomerase